MGPTLRSRRGPANASAATAPASGGSALGRLPDREYGHAMGLGGGPSWRDEYEWVRLDDLPDTPPPAARTAGGQRQPLAEAVLAW